MCSKVGGAAMCGSSCHPGNRMPKSNVGSGPGKDRPVSAGRERTNSGGSKSAGKQPRKRTSAHHLQQKSPLLHPRKYGTGGRAEGHDGVHKTHVYNANDTVFRVSSSDDTSDDADGIELTDACPSDPQFPGSDNPWESVRANLLAQPRLSLDVSIWGMKTGMCDTLMTPPRSPKCSAGILGPCGFEHRDQCDERATLFPQYTPPAPTDDAAVSCLPYSPRDAGSTPHVSQASTTQLPDLDSEFDAGVHFFGRTSGDADHSHIVPGHRRVSPDPLTYPCPENDDSMVLAPSPCGSPTVRKHGLLFSEKDLQLAFERHQVTDLFQQSSTQ
eukprot:m.152106 g.152106  ORF g.152106 m.152106 type:complete len:328 (-) comp17885_c0_seq5:191-1174(-)